MKSHTIMKITHLYILGALLLTACLVAAKKNKYGNGEEIPFYVNNVGPFSNPTETYEYLSLPFCQPAQKIKRPQGMGEFIEGDRAILSEYHLPFKKDIEEKTLCTRDLDQKEVEQFKKAIDKKYYFEMEYDRLPLWGFIGTVPSEYLDTTPADMAAVPHYLFTNLDFNVEYNGEQVIRINISIDNPNPQELKDGETNTVTFTYSVSWTPTDWPYDKRAELYKKGFFAQELEIHWLSIMNSFVLVVLLTGFLAIIIMRVLKSDYARYARTEEDEDADPDDYGWKLIHGDVFRFPPHKNVFSAFVGIGSQFLSMVIGILALSLLGLYYPNNGGNMYVSAIVLYALTTAIGGFVAARLYKQMNGDRWAWNIVLTAAVFVVPFVLAVSYVNSVAIYYKVTAALPALTIFEVVMIWLCVGFPLTVLGGIAGRRLAGQFEAPCRTKNFAREIPPIPFYRTLPFQMMMAGFLPFSAIYIELFYIYGSVWSQNTYYTLYGILCLVFIILLIVTACITVALTYFQLSMEDHRWWWNSFINGGSTGIFIYVYSIFYYMYRSLMTGVLQGSFYFAYMLVVCYFFFILLGSVGFFSSLVFVRRIYKNLKSD